MKEPKKLIAAKKVGLKVTDIDPEKDAKIADFIDMTEGQAQISKAYDALGIGSKRPTDKKLAKRFDAARKRLKNKGLI